MNNFEKIKNMAEEELAVFLTNISGYMNDNDDFMYDGPTKGSLDFREAIEDYLNWFKQEVKEEENKSVNENNKSPIIHYIKKMKNGEIILEHKTNGTLEAYKNAIDEIIKDLKSMIGKGGLLDVEDTKWTNNVENGISYWCRSYNLVYEEYVDEFSLLLYEE